MSNAYAGSDSAGTVLVVCNDDGSPGPGACTGPRSCSDSIWGIARTFGRFGSRVPGVAARTVLQVYGLSVADIVPQYHICQSGDGTVESGDICRW